MEINVAIMKGYTRWFWFNQGWLRRRHGLAVNLGVNKLNLADSHARFLLTKKVWTKHLGAKKPNLLGLNAGCHLTKKVWTKHLGENKPNLLGLNAGWL